MFRRMNTETLFLFSLTVLPLICTPGPDILFIASQALAGGTAASLRATAGIILGYTIHSALVALGLATLIATSPVLFEAIRWGGIAYLVYIALRLLKAAMQSGALDISTVPVKNQLARGFLTSLLNPKGMMLYVAILPQFIDHQRGDASLQAVLLSATFMIWCSLVYAGLGTVLGRIGAAGMKGERRRILDGMAGGMVLGAAGFMALTSH